MSIRRVVFDVSTEAEHNPGTRVMLEAYGCPINRRH